MTDMMTTNLATINIDNDNDNDYQVCTITNALASFESTPYNFLSCQGNALALICAHSRQPLNI